MTLDKEEHRKLFIDLINQSTFVGAAVDIVLELRDAVLSAGVQKQDAALTDG